MTSYKECHKLWKFEPSRPHTPRDQNIWKCKFLKYSKMAFSNMSNPVKHFWKGLREEREWVMSRVYWVMSHVNESCPIWMSHVTHMKESCPIWMGHIPYEWAMSHQIHVMEECEWVWMGRGTYWGSHVPYEWVTSHIWMSHVPYEWVMSHMNESCHINYMYWKSANEFEWDVAHIEGVMSHMNESCPAWVSHVPCMSESRPIWMSHVTSNTCTRRVRMNLNGTCHILQESCSIWMSHVPYEWVMWPQIHVLEECEWIWMSHVTYWRRHVPYEWVMSHMNESCPI